MWAGVEVFRVGEHLVGVEYDSDETLAALRERCARWLTDRPSEVPAAFGVRVAKVGFRRRRVGVVHHGAPVRYRVGGLEAAVGVIAEIFDDLVRQTPSNAVRVDARLFVRQGRALLVDVPLSVDVDERPLRSAGIDEVACWRPVVDPVAATVAVGPRSWPLAGVVVTRPTVPGDDACRRHVWSLGDGDVFSWAEMIDGMGESVVCRVDDLLPALQRLV